MDIRYLREPKLSNPSMIAAWPGMGYLAKISADYLRRRLEAKLFAEVLYYQNAIIYKKGIVELASIKHRFYADPKNDLIICVGDSQPPLPEEAYRLALDVVEVAKKYNVRRVYTMAAYPNEYVDEPQVYGVCTDEPLRDLLAKHGVKVLDEEGAVNGLNGILIGVSKLHGIDGICLLGDIKYANVPQHLSSKAVLEKLTSILELEIDTSQLEKRAKKIDASIKERLEDYQDEDELLGKERKPLGYIS